MHSFLWANVERMHHYQRWRARNVGLRLVYLKIMETVRLVAVVMAHLVGLLLSKCKSVHHPVPQSKRRRAGARSSLRIHWNLE